jgi:hypothetical protein
MVVIELMQWIESAYTKQQEAKSGKKILRADVTSQEFKDAVPVFYNCVCISSFSNANNT